MFQNRIKSLQDRLSDQEIDALLITSNYNISYLTGILAFSVEEREARVLVSKKQIYLFTDARYTQMVKSNSPFVTLLEANFSNPFIKQLKDLCEKDQIKYLGFEEENITYKEASELEEKITGVELIPTIDIVENERIYKDQEEIENVRQACSLSDQAFSHILTQIRPGLTEIELKIKLESFIRDNGGECSFQSIVAFGENSAIPHHLSSNSKLKTSDIILLDFGAKINGYCSDMTRTVFVGKPKESLEKVYTAVKEAQEIAIDYIKGHSSDGFELKKVQELSNSHLRSQGFADIPHSLGHGVGLQVHEMPTVSPFAEEQLKPGTIITVEPGVYIPSVGGVRIEDTALVTLNGIELLTVSTKELTTL